MSLGGWSNQTEDAIEVTERSLPATLENRGLALPFTTPPVAYSRIRFGDKGLEIILPGFKNELLANVIPFAKLPEIVSLTVFDRAFHEALEDTLTSEGPSALTPALIRKLATNIGETGLGGAEIMRRARSRKVIFANMEPAILNHLTSELISAYAKDQDPNLNMATAESQKLAALALEGFGQDFGIDGATVVERLKEISIFMANYKGPTKGMNGPVNDIISRLKLLAGDLRQWLIPEPVEEAEMAQRTALTAEAFVRATEPYTDNLDEVYDNIDRTIAQ
ncbi:MAG: hypothetical protein R3261_04705, partial [Alphaproteobacteria bacterium]|nr:hypothetical protein [Alphaproteobacteria bacterium]